MNTKIELACHDCIQLIANGETEGAGMDWDMDAALNTQELHEVSLADGEEYFSFEDCAVCHTSLPGYRHAVELIER